jgi:ABC-type Fe3+/spermidine/putrescine transport system ATPase subunit
MLELRNTSKSYDGKPIITDISFRVGVGETICLLGASGSGKSTLLRMIAGLESPDTGLITFNGSDLSNTPPHHRDFGLVFQDYSLFPHLSVFDNVAFGLRMRRLRANEINERVATLLKLVNLERFKERKITDLSGGEQQRVALVRALAIQPRLLMFDEPLGALDKKLKDGLLNEIRNILRQTKIPAIYVTHDQAEAFAIADRVLILHNGDIIRDGMPAELWANPGSKYVAEFLGLGNVLDGEVVGKNKNSEWKVESRFGMFAVRCTHKHSKGEKIHLLARPDFRVERSVLRLRASQHPLRSPLRTNAESGKELRRNTDNKITGIVADVLFQQDRYKVTFDNGLYVYLNKAPKIGRQISVRVKVECLA